MNGSKTTMGFYSVKNPQYLDETFLDQNLLVLCISGPSTSQETFSWTLYNNGDNQIFVLKAPAQPPMPGSTADKILHCL